MWEDETFLILCVCTVLDFLLWIAVGKFWQYPEESSNVLLKFFSVLGGDVRLEWWKYDFHKHAHYSVGRFNSSRRFNVSHSAVQRQWDQFSSDVYRFCVRYTPGWLRAIGSIGKSCRGGKIDFYRKIIPVSYYTLVSELVYNN